MQSHILKIAARHLLLPFTIMSIIILWRGHNQPGGGFIGGLVAASAFILYNVAYGVQDAKKILRLDPRTLIGIGLAIALFSALLSVFLRMPFMTGMWVDVFLPLLGHQHFGTPLLFDTGVYLTVLGVILTVVFTLSEES
ncbi:Na+/H+ antiporter subunit B [candidate division KSB1 bacterium]|nr:Na+/H+ antiporter subunit B [candidate division KSB1 bacterium]